MVIGISRSTKLRRISLWWLEEELTNRRNRIKLRLRLGIWARLWSSLSRWIISSCSRRISTSVLFLARRMESKIGRRLALESQDRLRLFRSQLHIRMVCRKLKEFIGRLKREVVRINEPVLIQLWFRDNIKDLTGHCLLLLKHWKMVFFRRNFIIQV